MKNPRDIIIAPLLTEKSTLKREAENVYSFKVARGANKRQIKEAFEELFKVEVISVNTMNNLGKMRRMGRFTGRRPSWKKANVKLAPGGTIPIFEGI
ncbi:MAG: 50S ribosomal protein L23 [Candidatus Zixiibacteriota bacterium]